MLTRIERCSLVLLSLGDLDDVLHTDRLAAGPIIGRPSRPDCPSPWQIGQRATPSVKLVVADCVDASAPSSSRYSASYKGSRWARVS